MGHVAKILFLGTPTFAVPCLQALVNADHEIVAAVSQPDRPQGRGRRSFPTPVAACARELSIQLLQPESCRDPRFLTEVAALAPDYLVVVAYGQILPETLLTLPRKLPINVHASLLPRWRGASPIAWAIASGDAVTGVTTMVVRRALDSGEVLLSAEEEIRPDDTAASLGARLSCRGAELLVSTILACEEGSITPVAQDESQVTWAHLLRKEDGRINWSEPAAVIDRKVRGFFPWPKTFTTRGGQRIAILGGRPLEGIGGEPGRVLSVDPGSGLVIGCGSGGYLVTQIQPESHTAISGAQFVHGYRVVAGERWGEEG
jgi:methionyl-tRNA formyltransferase